MSKLFLMMGAPGSGKSTWIKRQLKDNDYYISRDEIRFSLIDEDEDYFSHEIEVFDTFVKQIDNALMKPNARVFADASHLNRISRMKLINRISSNPTEINVIWLKTPLMTCYERNANITGRAFVPKHVIKSMYDSIQEPSANEDINKVYIIDGKTQELKVLILGGKNEEEFKF